MALYANVISLPYVNSGTGGSLPESVHMTQPLLINAPGFSFNVSGFEKNCLYESGSVLQNDQERKQQFVDRLNAAESSLWSTVDMIRKWPYSKQECMVYTHFMKRFGDLTNTGPWPLQEGECIHALPPLEVQELIDRDNAYIGNYKLHKNATKIYALPTLLSETKWLAFFREVCYIKGRVGSTVPIQPRSCMGRILGRPLMEDIEWNGIYIFCKAIGQVVHKQGLSTCDRSVCVGDKMTISWLNRG